MHGNVPSTQGREGAGGWAVRRFSDCADIGKHVSIFSGAATLARSAEVEALLRSATMETTGLQMPVTSSRIGLDCFHKCWVNSFMQYFEKVFDDCRKRDTRTGLLLFWMGQRWWSVWEGADLCLIKALYVGFLEHRANIQYEWNESESSVKYKLWPQCSLKKIYYKA